MKRRLLILSVIISVFVGACQSTPSGQLTDPAAVMDAYTAAINAHDVEAALALVADDVIYHRPTGDFNGKEAVRGFIEGLIARNVRVELVGQRTVDGERVSWRSHVFLADPENPDGPLLEIMNNSESIVRNGKIVMHTASRAQ